MKNIIIIPGFGENGKEAVYLTLHKFAQTKGLASYVMKIDWDYRVVTDYINQVLSFIESKKLKTDQTILFGFSFGALIAGEIAKKNKYLSLISCSCSPYFSENLKYIPNDAAVFFGKRRMNDFKNYTITSYSKILTRSSIFLFGSKDWEIAHKTAKKIAALSNSEFIFIPDTGHEITSAYMTVIQKKIGQYAALS